MTIHRFLPRANNITKLVQWTGSNLNDIEELLNEWGWTQQYITNNLSVDGDVLHVSYMECQPGQWFGMGNPQGIEDADLQANYQEITGTGPHAYVLDDEGA